MKKFKFLLLTVLSFALVACQSTTTVDVEKLAPVYAEGFDGYGDVFIHPNMEYIAELTRDILPERASLEESQTLQMHLINFQYDFDLPKEQGTLSNGDTVQVSVQLDDTLTKKI